MKRLLLLLLLSACGKPTGRCGAIKDIQCMHHTCRVFLSGPEGTYFVWVGSPYIIGETLCEHETPNGPRWY